MDGYQFVASLVKSIASLAWPAAFILAVFLFRERLGSLLPLLKVKHKDWEASFRLDQAEKEAAELPPAAPLTEATQPTPEEKSRFERLADLSPRAAILELRTDLEQVVIKLAAQYGGSGVIPINNLQTATRALRNSKFIGPHISALLDDLRSVGNSAAHNPEIEFTKDDAMRYRALFDRVNRELLAVEYNMPTATVQG